MIRQGVFDDARDIDWVSFGDGLAEIPELFDHLLSDKARTRAFGVKSLSKLLSPASGSSQAALAALPFIFEAIAHDGLADRDGLAWLLADLAAGGNYPRVLLHGLQPEALPTPGREIHDALAARSQQLVPLLAATSARLRAAVVLPLAMTGQHDVLAAALANEKNKTVRASLLIGLGLAPGRHTTELARAAASDADEGIRFGAACGLTLTTHGSHPAAIEVVAAAIADGVRLPKSFPWCRGDAEGMAMIVAVGGCLRSGDLGPLERLFAGGSNLRLAAAIVRTVFDRSSELRLPKDLSEAERGILRVVALSNTHAPPLFRTLNDHGFCGGQKCLLRYAGGSDSGPLDAPAVDGSPLWKHVRSTMDDRLDFEALAAQIPDQTDVRALAEDALGGYLALHLPFPHPRGPAQLTAAQGYAKLAGICATLLRQRSDPSALGAWMDELLDELRVHAKPRRAVCTTALVAWVRLADPESSAIMAHASVFQRAVMAGAEPLLRPIVERLAVADRAELVLAIPPDIVFDRRIGEHILSGCIPYLDMVPTEQAAAVAVTALTEHKNPPVAKLIEILRTIGEPAGPVTAAALEKDLAVPIRDALASV